MRRRSRKPPAASSSTLPRRIPERSARRTSTSTGRRSPSIRALDDAAGLVRALQGGLDAGTARRRGTGRGSDYGEGAAGTLPPLHLSPSGAPHRAGAQFRAAASRGALAEIAYFFDARPAGRIRFGLSQKKNPPLPAGLSLNSRKSRETEPD